MSHATFGCSDHKLSMCSTADPEFDEGWIECVSRRMPGVKYYFNVKTNCSIWKEMVPQGTKLPRYSSRTRSFFRNEPSPNDEPPLPVSDSEDSNAELETSSNVNVSSLPTFTKKFDKQKFDDILHRLYNCSHNGDLNSNNSFPEENDDNTENFYESDNSFHKGNDDPRNYVEVHYMDCDNAVEVSEYCGKNVNESHHLDSIVNSHSEMNLNGGSQNVVMNDLIMTDFSEPSANSSNNNFWKLKGSDEGLDFASTDRNNGNSLDLNDSNMENDFPINPDKFKALDYSVPQLKRVTFDDLLKEPVFSKKQSEKSKKRIATKNPESTDKGLSQSKQKPMKTAVKKAKKPVATICEMYGIKTVNYDPLPLELPGDVRKSNLSSTSISSQSSLGIDNSMFSGQKTSHNNLWHSDDIGFGSELPWGCKKLNLSDSEEPVFSSKVIQNSSRAKSDGTAGFSISEMPNAVRKPSLSDSSTVTSITSINRLVDTGESVFQNVNCGKSFKSNFESDLATSSAISDSSDTSSSSSSGSSSCTGSSRSNSD